MILSREQIEDVSEALTRVTEAIKHEIEYPASWWTDLIETVRATHDAMYEVKRLTTLVNDQRWELDRREAEAEAARAELSALRDRITALHVECTCCAPPTCKECTSLTYPCATARLLEGDSDGAS